MTKSHSMPFDLCIVDILILPASTSCSPISYILATKVSNILVFLGAIAIDILFKSADSYVFNLLK